MSDDGKIAEALEASGGNKTVAAEALGMPRTTLRRKLKAMGIGLRPASRGPSEAPQERSRTWAEDGDKARCEYASPRPIRTLEEALEHAEVDRSAWRVRSWEVVAWQVGMKLRSFNDRGRITGEVPQTENLWRVKLVLERILPRPLEDATGLIVERMKGYSPDYSGVPAFVRPRDGHLLEIDIFDAHFGKMAWREECGEDYDLKIAERVYRNAVDDLMGYAGGFAVDRIILPIGNDFIHIDGPGNATTSGTVVDTDGRYAKIVAAAEMGVIWAVERLSAVAPVEIVLVPGNHDRMTSWHVCRTVAAWFRSHPDVAVDTGPKLRKRVRYGKTLLGYTHGNEEKAASLPILMATEWPEDWAQTKYREWRCGHIHRAKERHYQPLDTDGGVVVRYLRSLSAIDAWHYRVGYVGSRRAAECFLTHPEEGPVGHFTANVRV